MRLIAKFTVPGKPIAKGRPRFGRGHTYTPKATKDAEETIRQYAQVALRDWQATGPIRFYLQFYFERPRVPMGIYPQGRPDLSNLVKLAEDALSPWMEDSLVVELTATKQYGKPRTELTIIALWEADPLKAEKEGKDE